MSVPVPFHLTAVHIAVHVSSIMDCPVVHAVPPINGVQAGIRLESLSPVGIGSQLSRVVRVTVKTTPLMATKIEVETPALDFGGQPSLAA